jgi:hypothetical protein
LCFYFSKSASVAGHLDYGAPVVNHHSVGKFVSDVAYTLAAMIEWYRYMLDCVAGFPRARFNTTDTNSNSNNCSVLTICQDSARKTSVKSLSTTALIVVQID